VIVRASVVTVAPREGEVWTLASGSILDVEASHLALSKTENVSEKVRRLAGRTPWMWTLAFGHHEDRTPTHGYAATRGAAMAAFAKSWRRG
jgi:hypothetical protein